VIAFSRGSIPEIVDNRSGFIVQDNEGAVAAIKNIHLLPRQTCRLAFERRFTASRMTLDYVSIYERLAGAKPDMNVAIEPGDTSQESGSWTISSV